MKRSLYTCIQPGMHESVETCTFRDLLHAVVAAVNLQ